MGLVRAVIEDDLAMEPALQWARLIAEFSAWTVSQTKKLVYEAQHLALNDAIEREDRIATEGYARHEALEGFTAFMQGRRPTF